ncbi:hypothetical protein RCC89_15845 [Cytophagaceae bacterium ABcell3]|nr:hypothetical protein RCC89_15845 [Cytophagaceae bacterium ABcell3]
MKHILKTCGLILAIIFLTATTQIGGIVLLICLPIFELIDKSLLNKLYSTALKPLTFITLYLFASLTLVPFLAGLSGRVPLPVYSNDHLKPLSIFTCFLNRHYVKPELLEITEHVASQMHVLYPGTVTSYLDANFPFIDKFPLLPHWSHNDGKKLDLAFFYRELHSGKRLNKAPSYIGYGVFEEPITGEQDTPTECASKGFIQYSSLRYLVPQNNKAHMPFDQERTKKIIELLLQESNIGKIFIEPHLKERMGLKHEKIRFHGCHAVRHDDHIHFQLK